MTVNSVLCCEEGIINYILLYRFLYCLYFYFDCVFSFHFISFDFSSFFYVYLLCIESKWIWCWLNIIWVEIIHQSCSFVCVCVCVYLQRFRLLVIDGWNVLCCMWSYGRWAQNEQMTTNTLAMIRWMAACVDDDALPRCSWYMAAGWSPNMPKQQRQAQQIVSETDGEKEENKERKRALLLVHFDLYFVFFFCFYVCCCVYLKWMMAKRTKEKYSWIRWILIWKKHSRHSGLCCVAMGGFTFSSKFPCCSLCWFIFSYLLYRYE